MESFSNQNNNHINLNVSSNIECNIGKVMQSVRNTKDARWFCMLNSNYYFYF